MKKEIKFFIAGVITAVFLFSLAYLAIGQLSSKKDDKNSDLEIERKFLIETNKIPYKLESLDRYSLTQGYISFSPEIRVRKADDTMFFLNIKAPVDAFGLVREEKEYNIMKEEYERLFKKVEGNVITKDRYQGKEGEDMFAIDIYTGDLQGLAVMEVEFDSVEKANKYVPPTWVGKDVTEDKRYKNANLARNGLKNIEDLGK